MEATKNIITIDNAISRLDDIQRKFEDVSPIWKSGKPRSEMTDKEIKILSEYENMMDCETIGIKVGDKVAYRLDGDNKIYSGTVIDILDRGDIRTDTDGVLCAGQYAKINTTPTETPQISTKTAETVNVSTEGENAAERTEYRVSRFGDYKIIVGDRVQGKVIAVLMSVNGHNTIEINEESAHIATMGEKPLRIDKPIMQLSDAEVLELIYKPTQPQDEPREAENKPTAADVAQMVKTELAKNKAMHTVWHLEFPDGTECDMRYKLTAAAGCDFYEYTESRDGAEVFKDYKATACDITLYVCQRLDLDVLELLQSLEVAQTA